MNEDQSESALPESWAPPTCRLHRETVATRFCTKCQEYYCPACLRTRRVGNQTVEFCPTCGGSCQRLDEPVQENAAGDQSFYARLPSVFASPFRGDGPIILIAGTIFFGLVNLAGFVPLVGLAMFVIGAGYLCAFLMNVIATAARGDASLPSWPDFSNTWDDIVQPALNVLGTLLLCLGPATGYRIFANISGTAPGAAPDWPYWLLLGLGGFYLPMALLGVGVLDGLHGLNPLIGIPAIGKVPGAYLITCALFGLLYAAGEWAMWLNDAVPIAGALAGGFVSLYLAVVQMRLLGTLYHANRDRFNWV